MKFFIINQDNFKIKYFSFLLISKCSSIPSLFLFPQIMKLKKYLKYLKKNKKNSKIKFV